MRLAPIRHSACDASTDIARRKTCRSHADAAQYHPLSHLPFCCRRILRWAGALQAHAVDPADTLSAVPPRPKDTVPRQARSAHPSTHIRYIPEPELEVAPLAGAGHPKAEVLGIRFSWLKTRFLSRGQSSRNFRRRLVSLYKIHYKRRLNGSTARGHHPPMQVPAGRAGVAGRPSAARPRARAAAGRRAIRSQAHGLVYSVWGIPNGKYGMC